MGVKQLARREDYSVLELFGMDGDWVEVREPLPKYGDTPLFFSRKSQGYFVVMAILTYPHLRDAIEKVCRMGYAARRDMESRWDEEA